MQHNIFKTPIANRMIAVQQLPWLIEQYLRNTTCLLEYLQLIGL